MRQQTTRHTASARRAAALLAAMIAVAVSLVTGVTFLSRALTATAVASAVQEHAESRQIAETGLQLAIAYIERSPDWRLDAPLELWADDMPLLDGAVTITASFANPPLPLPELNDPSFEQQIASLPNPLLGPPMSGVIGGWNVSRSALVQTGLTVPRVGVTTTPGATDGVAHAYITFLAAVNGSASFTQDLAVALPPSATCTLTLDITTVGLPLLDPSVRARLYAGPTLLSCTTQALVNPAGLSLADLLASALALLTDATQPAVLLTSLISGTTSEHSLSFQTGDAPPPGDLAIELAASSLGLLTTVYFDNVRVRVEPNDPVRLTAVARSGSAAHTASVTLARDLAGRARIIEWDEP